MEEVPESKAPSAPEGVAGAKTSALAIWSLVLGILALCVLLTSLPGLILGIVALVKINGSQGRLAGKGLAIAGTITSGVALVSTPIVLSIMLPAFVQTKLRAQEAQAQMGAMELRNALMSYFTEYQHFPVLEQPQPKDVHTSSQGGVMEVLLGRSQELNPRGIRFLSLPGEVGEMLDPWGNPYQIALDANGDEEVQLPGEGEERVSFSSRVVVWSYGPDGEAGGTAEGSNDDIYAQ